MAEPRYRLRYWEDFQRPPGVDRWGLSLAELREHLSRLLNDPEATPEEIHIQRRERNGPAAILTKEKDNACS